MALDYGMRVVPFRPGIGDVHEVDLVSAHATTPATGGTWTLTVDGQTTSGIAADATPSAVQSALEALSNVAPGDVACSMDAGADLGDAGAVMRLVWGGAFAGTNPTVTADFAGLTGNPHVFEARLRQVLTIPSGKGSDRTIKLARFRMGGASALDTITAGARVFFGVTDGTTSLSCSSSAEDNVLALIANAGYQTDTDSVLRTPTAHAAFVAFASAAGSIEVEWIGTPPDLRASVALFFGDDLEAVVGTVDGSATQNAAVTFDPGFTHDPVLLECFSVGQAFVANGSGNEAMVCHGSAGRAGGTITSSCFVVCAEHQQSPTSSGIVGVSGRSAVRLTSAAGTVTQGAGLEVTGMAADELEFTTRDAAQSLSIMFWAIAVPGGVRGVSIAETLAAGATGVEVVDSIGFLPLALAMASGRTGTVGTVGSGQGNVSVGETDGIAQGCCAWRSRDNVTTTETQSLVSETRLVDVLDGDTTHDWIGEFDAFTPDGAEVDVTDAAGGSRVVAYWALEDLVRVDPDPTELELALPVPARLLTETPAAVALPLALPAPQVLATETPAPVELALALPAPARLLTATPDPAEVPLALPVPQLLAAETPSPVDLALVVPAPARLLTETPAPVELDLALPAPALLVELTPAPVELELVLPAPTVVAPDVQQPAPVELALVVPAPARLLTATPAATELALGLPSPQLLVAETPAPAVLALALPAPQVLATLAPASVALALVLPAPTLLLGLNPVPLELALALPAPAVLGQLQPDSVVLALVLPAPTLGIVVGVVLGVELPREALLRAELARSAMAPVELPRSLELAAALE